MPMAKPQAGVGLPPNWATSPSYDLRQQTVPCAPRRSVTHSKTVRLQ